MAGMGRLAGRTIVLISHNHRAADESGFRMIVQYASLKIERARQAQVIVVKKTYVFAFAVQETDIPRAGHALVSLKANMPDTFQPPTNRCRFIRRSIIDHDDFDVRAGVARALDSFRQQMRPPVCRDNDAGLDHLLIAFPAGDKIYVERIVLKIKLTEKDYGMIGDLD